MDDTNLMPFLDSHCHLDKLKLDEFGHDLTTALDVAVERGVERFLCIGIGLDNLDRVIAIAEKHSPVYAAIGIHPSEYSDDALITRIDSTIERLRLLAQHKEVVAIGETGLDFSRNEKTGSPDTMSSQLASFRAHLALARDLALPVVVHTRDAQAETLDALREVASPHAGVLHCFTESWEMAGQALLLGYYISISGIVTFRNADNVREVAKRVPLNRLLVETDSPWLAPVPHRGCQNQPSYVVDVFNYLAELRGESIDELATAVWGNFHRLFARCC